MKIIKNIFISFFLISLIMMFSALVFATFAAIATLLTTSVIIKWIITGCLIISFLTGLILYGEELRDI